MDSPMWATGPACATWPHAEEDCRSGGDSLSKRPLSPLSARLTKTTTSHDVDGRLEEQVPGAAIQPSGRQQLFDKPKKGARCAERSRGAAESPWEEEEEEHLSAAIALDAHRSVFSAGLDERRRAAYRRTFPDQRDWCVSRMAYDPPSADNLMMAAAPGDDELYWLQARALFHLCSARPLSPCETSPPCSAPPLTFLAVGHRRVRAPKARRLRRRAPDEREQPRSASPVVQRRGDAIQLRSSELRSVRRRRGIHARVAVRPRRWRLVRCRLAATLAHRPDAAGLALSH